MKSYTNLEQSRKLAEILPLESADMFYDGVQDLYKENVYNIPINGSSITVRTGHIITKKDIKANLLLPCWSLAALLSVLPTFTIDSSDDHYFRVHCYAQFSEWHNNTVDACYAMIIKLHELNLL